LQARLGCGADERARAQGVRFDVEISFEKLPAGAVSDQLEGTICYAGISGKLGDICASGEFRLVEHLAWKAYQTLPQAPGTRVWMRVTKLRPPVAGLEGGASFELGERLSPEFT
jgi:dihydroneopterin aldolase